MKIKFLFSYSFDNSIQRQKIESFEQNGTVLTILNFDKREITSNKRNFIFVTYFTNLEQLFLRNMQTKNLKTKSSEQNKTTSIFSFDKFSIKKAWPPLMRKYFDGEIRFVLDLYLNLKDVNTHARNFYIMYLPTQL